MSAITTTSSMFTSPSYLSTAFGDIDTFSYARDGQIGGSNHNCIISKGQIGGGSLFCVISRDDLIVGRNDNFTRGWIRYNILTSGDAEYLCECECVNQLKKIQTQKLNTQSATVSQVLQGKILKGGARSYLCFSSPTWLNTIFYHNHGHRPIVLFLLQLDYTPCSIFTMLLLFIVSMELLRCRTLANCQTMSDPISTRCHRENHVDTLKLICINWGLRQTQTNVYPLSWDLCRFCGGEVVRSKRWEDWRSWTWIPLL